MKLYLLLSLMSCTLHITKKERSILGVVHTEFYSCSGVFVSPTTILTADHCVERADKQWVKTANNKSFTATVLKHDKKTDLALISIDVPYYPYAFLGEPPEIADHVYTVNSGDGFEKTYSEGVVENIVLYNEDDTAESIWSTVPIRMGASGSGLFNKDGKLIGINVAKVEEGSLAVKTQDIKKFLND